MLIVIAVLLGVGAYVAYSAYQRFMVQVLTVPGCQAGTGPSAVPLDFGQAADAATVAAVAVRDHLPERALTIAYATAFQESKLENLSYGDRDSVGIFQQRPSQGWGTQAQILNPVYSTTKFYQALLNVSGWQSKTLTDAAQAVQNSGSPTAYAQWEQFATVLSGVFTGSAGAGLGCTLDGPTFPAQSKVSGTLLTARGQAVVNELRTEFGSANVGKVDGIAADGHSFGLAAPASVSGAAATTREWAYANWAAAQAETLGITQVSYGGKTWSASDGAAGWKADSSATANAGSVHIAVAS